MNWQRPLAFAGVMLAGAALVAWWCAANKVITMDSPFASPTFRDYFIFAFAGEVVIGLPYGFGVRAVLRRIGRWSPLTIALAALLPGALVFGLVGGADEFGRTLGTCLLIAAGTMALGWWALGVDGPRQSARA